MASGNPRRSSGEAQEGIMGKRQGGGQGLLGLLVCWGIVGWWWRLSCGHADIVWVARVVIGAGSGFGGLGLRGRSGEDTEASDWKFCEPSSSAWWPLHLIAWGHQTMCLPDRPCQAMFTFLVPRVPDPGRPPFQQTTGPHSLWPCGGLSHSHPATLALSVASREFYRVSGGW